MPEDETAYYLRRAVDELAKAEQTECVEAEQAHREMHRRYLEAVKCDSGKAGLNKPKHAPVRK